jgi:hypothetical protein
MNGGTSSQNSSVPVTWVVDGMEKIIGYIKSIPDFGPNEKAALDQSLAGLQTASDALKNYINLRKVGIS